ncbi:MAG TPA: YggS family pyridoxal phosphate-dependent enzyme [Flavisolibacter sp.]|nr:YggS family pyridoxal phosphate-dependent enzyme [Flavisolibacter sp.]
MLINEANFRKVSEELREKNVTLVAVSKTKPVEAIRELYDLGQRDFGENYVQELISKKDQLPADIRWHFIGHLQSNKAKLLVPFVHLIHGIDSFKLLNEVNKAATRAGRVQDVLLQVHIASEETKFGLDDGELEALMKEKESKSLQFIKLSGFMGMASFTEDKEKVRREFRTLRMIADVYGLPILSMGMSGDYQVAVEEGSNMVRIGSLLFGERNKT